MSTKERLQQEYVMVFPTALLTEIGHFQGLRLETREYVRGILEAKKYVFIPRRDAENDPDYKQLIPYAILSHGARVFSYRRGKLLAEERLLSKYSIGVGGHISVRDPSLFGKDYEEGLRREIDEEVRIEGDIAPRLVGLLNDDQDEVGRVHFGLIYVLLLTNPAVRPREKSIAEPRFLSPLELRNDLSKYESWSKLCIHRIEDLLAFAQRPLSRQ